MINLILHSLQPSRGAVNFILAQLYIGVNMQGQSTDRQRRYRASVKDCHACPLKAQCTTNKQGRSLCRSVDEEYLDRVRAYQPTEPYKKALRKRSVWVEPLFAEGKDWHGMRRLRLRELERVNG